jgi:phthiodiolone/phenolphthiodiolone dimycocerosates ketoreductase
MPDPNKVTIGLTVGTQPPLGRVGALVRLARVLRFDVAWAVDHFLGFFPQALWDRDFSWLATSDGTPHAFYDYQALLGHLGHKAGRMQLAVGVTEPIRRHPVLIAQTFMTIAHVTKRPPILGIGAGEAENVVPYGLDFSTPVARLEEAVQIIRLCFDSRGPFDFEGDHFSLRGAVMDLSPPEGRTPEIWIAAHRPRMLALTGRYGDGWYPTFPFSVAEYESLLGEIRTAAVAAERDPDLIVPGWQAFAVIGRSERAARKLLESKAVRFTALLAPAYTWRKLGVEHPLGADFRGMIDFVPEVYSRAELESAIASVPTDLLAEATLWGTPASVLSSLHEYVDAGLRHLVLQPVSALVSRSDAIYSLRSLLSMQRKLRRRGVPASATPKIS